MNNVLVFNHGRGICSLELALAVAELHKHNIAIKRCGDFDSIELLRQDLAGQKFPVDLVLIDHFFGSADQQLVKKICQLSLSEWNEYIDTDASNQQPTCFKLLTLADQAFFGTVPIILFLPEASEHLRSSLGLWGVDWVAQPGQPELDEANLISHSLGLIRTRQATNANVAQFTFDNDKSYGYHLQPDEGIDDIAWVRKRKCS